MKSRCHDGTKCAKGKCIRENGYEKKIWGVEQRTERVIKQQMKEGKKRKVVRKHLRLRFSSKESLTSLLGNLKSKLPVRGVPYLPRMNPMGASHGKPGLCINVLMISENSS